MSHAIVPACFAIGAVLGVVGQGTLAWVGVLLGSLIWIFG